MVIQVLVSFDTSKKIKSNFLKNDIWTSLMIYLRNNMFGYFIEKYVLTRNYEGN